MAYYDAHVRIDGDGRESIRPVFVTWGPHRDSGKYHTQADLDAIEGEAVRRGLLAPFRKLATDTPESQMHVRVSPLDERFPQLVRACDPQYVRDLVAAAHAAINIGAPASKYSITFIRYHPGQRHVLRYDPQDAPEFRPIFAKLYHTSEDSERILHRAKQIGEWLAEYGEGARSIRPLASVAEDAVVLYARVVGTPLSNCLRRIGQSLASPLKGTGAALYALHQLPQAFAVPLESQDFVAELEEIARASEHVSTLLPSVGATIKALLERARELYERLPVEPPAFAHGDFKADHVWVTPDGLTLIDFDSCHLGDPALDVGKFLADLRFWYAIYGHKGLKQAQECFLVGYAPGTLTERVMRARVYESVELVKLAVRRVHLFEDDWATRTKWLIGLAEAVLNDLQLGPGFAVKQSPLPGPRGALPKLRVTGGGHGLLEGLN